MQAEVRNPRWRLGNRNTCISKYSIRIQTILMLYRGWNFWPLRLGNIAQWASLTLEHMSKDVGILYICFAYNPSCKLIYVYTETTMCNFGGHLGFLVDNIDATTCQFVSQSYLWKVIKAFCESRAVLGKTMKSSVVIRCYPQYMTLNSCGAIRGMIYCEPQLICLIVRTYPICSVAGLRAGPVGCFSDNM